MQNVLQNVLELLACKEKRFTRDCKLYKLGGHLFLQLFGTSKCCPLLLGEQECPSCKICHMENVLKNTLVVPFVFQTTTRDVEKTSCVSPS